MHGWRTTGSLNGFHPPRVAETGRDCGFPFPVVSVPGYPVNVLSDIAVVIVIVAAVLGIVAHPVLWVIVIPGPWVVRASRCADVPHLVVLQRFGGGQRRVVAALCDGVLTATRRVAWTPASDPLKRLEVNGGRSLAVG